LVDRGSTQPDTGFNLPAPQNCRHGLDLFGHVSLLVGRPGPPGYMTNISVTFPPAISRISGIFAVRP
jgi:hypothetical protein